MKSFVNNFGYAAKGIRKTDIRVINLNPRSAVKCFSFSTIDKVLKNDKIRNNEKKMGGSDISPESTSDDESGVGSGTAEKGA